MVAFVYCVGDNAQRTYPREVLAMLFWEWRV